MERRSEDDIVRNGMVGIFLRLLEYHQGVLFLTTNRVKCFDEAFHSRISVALEYPELREDVRQKVWKNILDAAGLQEGSFPRSRDKISEKGKSGMDTDELSKEELNGRQIRTVVRLAQALAKTESVPVDMQHLRRTAAVATKFQKSIISKQAKLDTKTSQ